jgi:RNA polymerase-binding transcription factor
MTTTTAVPQETATNPALRSLQMQIEADYAEAARRHRKLVQNMFNDSAGDDVADAGTKAAVTGQDEAELQILVDRRIQMERAIERLNAGIYGICESCGDQIPTERLELFPFATTCVTCKQKAERHDRR